MNRLRTLAGIALIAGIFAGLSSCANKKGDLGAELDAPPSLVAAEAPRRSSLDITSPAEIPDADTVDLQDPKNRTPQSVSVNRDAKIRELNKAAADEKKEPQHANGGEGEVVVIGDAKTPKPVTAPAAKEVKVASEATVAPKDEVKVDAPAAKVATSDADKASAALALLNKQADEAARGLSSKSVSSTPEAASGAVAKKLAAGPELSASATVKPADGVAVSPNVPQNATPDDDKNKDKTPPKPETPPVVGETDQQRAERLLKEAEKLASVQHEASSREAEANYQAGLRLFNDWEYEKAKTYFERALSIDPTHEAAREKLRTVKSLLNIDLGMGSMMKNLADTERVKIQEQSITLAHYMEEARSFETRGSETVMDSAADGKITSISERLRFLEQAQDRYRRMIEIINWMPPAAELPGLRRQAEEALMRVRGKIDKYNEEVRYNNRMIALKEAEKLRTRDTELARVRIQKMLEHVDELIRIHDYKNAEQMALRVLIVDPLNVDAEKLKKRARSLAHENERTEFQELYRSEYRSSMQDNDEATIASDPLIKYPANWEQISKRSDVTIGRKIQEEPWKSEIRKKLQRKVALEFVDTKLEDVIVQLRSLSGVTMIIDPKVLQANPPLINLRVPDMNLDVALDWILKLAELEYVLQDHAIFIGKPQTLQAPLEMRIYDVSDLTSVIQDFPGPEFQITVAGDKNAGGGGGGGGLLPFGGGAKTTPPTNATIQEMIKTRIMPLSWDPATGASIEEKGGKLVVMQRPEIHALIEQLLSNFRSTQKMMINIESRFLTIREAYLEQTGVEFQGLDPNALFGDFGDLRRLGAPTGFLQPRVPASTDSTPPNLPFPGFVNGPDRTNGGVVSEVGSIVNHVINFFPNDPDTISSQDTTNTVRQGGLSAQVTVLNNAQVQAFIRALAVRENSSTLIAPRLTVFNTQRANMFIARQQSYVSDYEISGDSYDPVVRQFLVGVVLDVKPIVSSDRRYVTLELRPTVTELTNFVTRQIDTFTVNAGAQVNVLVLLSFPIQFPELAITKVRTTATVPDGGIMLIGGLYKNVKFNAENGVPFLSDLPVVGRLFRWNVGRQCQEQSGDPDQPAHYFVQRRRREAAPLTRRPSCTPAERYTENRPNVCGSGDHLDENWT